MSRELPKIEGFTRKEIVSFMRWRIRYDWEWTKKAVLTLYNRQTESEKRKGISDQHNDIGFSGYDAPYLTFVAIRINKKEEFDASEKAEIQRIIRRYGEQMVEASDVDKLEKALHEYYYRGKKRIEHESSSK